ncbi:MAG: LuxR family transcriptional regulator [Nocardioides sp.]|uniref:LuxR family transcriptional regulator n=1 Tax=Nocardioides sp. TaxID=35761 RepID=UPI0039E72615
MPAEPGPRYGRITDNENTWEAWVSEQSSESREILEGPGFELYELAVSAGMLRADDPRLAEGGEYADALGVLVELGLLQHEPESSRWVPVDPTAVRSRIVTPMSLEATRLIEESSQWARDFGVLSQAWRRSSVAEQTGPFTYLRRSQVGRYIEGVMLDCQEELLTAQPQAGRDVAGLPDSIDLERQVLERGGIVHTLYQHAARRDAATREYVVRMAELGAEVRTLDEFFPRTIIVDRRVAIIPTPDPNTVAVAVREPSVLAYLADLFERSWQRARRFSSTDVNVLRDIAAEQRSMTMRLLAEGHSDPVAAKRLGVSPRTYAGYVADLKREFEVETRFQLGYMVGLTGQPLGPADEDAPPADKAQ